MGHGKLKEILTFTLQSVLGDTHTEGEATKPVPPFQGARREVLVGRYVSMGSMQNTSCKNAGLDEAQVGIRIAGKNINTLRYPDDTTLMAESKELKSLLMKVKEEREEDGLKLNIQKTNIIASGPITSQKIDGEKIANSDRLYFLGLQNHYRW